MTYVIYLNTIGHIKLHTEAVYVSWRGFMADELNSS